MVKISILDLQNFQEHLNINAYYSIFYFKNKIVSNFIIIYSSSSLDKFLKY